VDEQGYDLRNLTRLFMGMADIYRDRASVVIDGHPKVCHNVIVSVLNACHLAKITSISFASR